MAIAKSNEGAVCWITGLSGAGKTTISRLVYEELRRSKPNVVLLDGDLLREVIGEDLGYSREDRMISAMRNARLSRVLSNQGIDVVCATISMFDQCREWNRLNIRNYKEVYLRAPMNVLIARDDKGLYKRAHEGNEQHVYGVDLEYEEPKAPDLIIDNDGTLTPEDVAARILKILTPPPSAGKGENA